MDRLFVALRTDSYNEFRNAGKAYELRSYGRQFTEKDIYKERRIELRRGYSGESIWGTFGEVFIGQLPYIFSRVPSEKISPNSKSVEEAIQECISESGVKEKYILFEVLLD